MLGHDPFDADVDVFMQPGAGRHGLDRGRNQRQRRLDPGEQGFEPIPTRVVGQVPDVVAPVGEDVEEEQVCRWGRAGLCRRGCSAMTSSRPLCQATSSPSTMAP
jgi:hypothetical protein